MKEGSERCKSRRSSWTVSFWFALQFKEGFFLSIQDAESSWEHDSKRWRAFSPCPRLCPRLCPRRLCHGPGACNWNPRLECRQDPLFAFLAPPPSSPEFTKNHRYSHVSSLNFPILTFDFIFWLHFGIKWRLKSGEDVEFRSESFWFLLQDLDTQSLKLVHHCEITIVQLERSYFHSLTSIREIIFPFIYFIYVKNWIYKFSINYYNKFISKVWMVKSLG